MTSALRTTPFSLRRQAGTLPRSAAFYTRLTLPLYDLFVVRFTSPYAWGTRQEVIHEHYEKHCATDHAEVGVGTGYFLTRVPRRWSSLTLVDPNRNALAYTAERLDAPAVAHTASILSASALPAVRFKSVAANYLLHCLPGPMTAKEPAIANLAELTADDGVLFGATVLGNDDVAHNPLGKALMTVCNRTGAFGNAADTEDALRLALEKNFRVVDVWRSNAVALFTAREPRRGQDDSAGPATHIPAK